ncbi:MAG TPA: hypothetical protein VFL62_03070 [Bradyrhizobium sp.]|uniref:outer membrane protein n=1 Tax=Bradyrhizobium sp. TaxID=376 RepID=UPI002D7EA452|nr:hypothetical protein [Bradyrhizobium sp.]HET7885187.1 hypothetical protein [Bradyrhizobium sp.]
MKKLILALSATAFLGSAPFVFAADMAVKAPPPPVSPMTDWSGFYIGVHGGGGWNGTNDWYIAGGPLIGSGGLNGSGTTAGNSGSWAALSGGLAGGQIGYNWQINHLVFGVQGDGSWANIKGSAGNPLNLVDGRCSFAGTPDQTAECRTNIRAMGNLTARVGYLVTPSTLFYGKAGVNITSIDFQVLNDIGFSGTCGAPGVGTRYPGYNVVNRTTAGATAGLGIEQRVWNNLTVFGEYDVVQTGGSFSNFNTGGTGAGGCTNNFVSQTNIGTATQLFKVGLNYQLH